MSSSFPAVLVHHLTVPVETGSGLAADMAYRELRSRLEVAEHQVRTSCICAGGLRTRGKVAVPLFGIVWDRGTRVEDAPLTASPPQTSITLGIYALFRYLS